MFIRIEQNHVYLNGFQLKIIAIVAMFLNHLGIIFHFGETHPIIFVFTESIGKLTFPIMAFLLVEGFHYTHSVMKYALRLAFFWILSIVPFHWLHSPLMSAIDITDLVNNIFFTLLMGLMLIWMYSKTESRLLRILIVLFFSFMTILSDYNLIGPLLVFGFYIIKNRTKKVVIPIIVLTSSILIIYIIAWIMYPQSITNIGVIISALAPLINIPILLAYDGKRGPSNALIKWGFYCFYPLHLTILALLRYVILGW